MQHLKPIQRERDSNCSTPPSHSLTAHHLKSWQYHVQRSTGVAGHLSSLLNYHEVFFAGPSHGLNAALVPDEDSLLHTCRGIDLDQGLCDAAGHQHHLAVIPDGCNWPAIPRTCHPVQPEIHHNTVRICCGPMCGKHTAVCSVLRMYKELLAHNRGSHMVRACTCVQCACILWRSHLKQHSHCCSG